MKTLPIKAFEFTGFFEAGWYKWKTNALDMAEAHSDNLLMEMAYKTSSVTKTPIMFDKNDWRFLIQFPPKFWREALMWRYNEGLRLISKLRKDDPHGRLPDLNEVPQFIFNKKDGSQIIFKPPKGNFFLGLTDLVRKLEKPIKFSHVKSPGEQYYTPEEMGTKGIDEIDPYQQDPNHPEWRGHYKGGYHDADLSDLVEVPEDYIAAYEFKDMPLEYKELPDDHPKKKKYLEKARKNLGRNLHHTFAGMGVLKPAPAITAITNWIKAQALGVLGEVGDKIKDPNTGQVYDISYMTGDELKQINKKWPTHVGHGAKDVRLTPAEKKAGLTPEEKRLEIGWTQHKPTGEKNIIKSEKIPLTLPVIRKNYEWTEVKPDGKRITRRQKNVPIPVLRRGRILPGITPELDQRRAFAQRRGFDPRKQWPYLSHLTWKDFVKGHPEVEFAIRSIVKEKSRPGKAQDLLDFWDLLSPEQREKLATEHKDLIHYIAHKHGGKIQTGLNADKRYIVGGVDINKNQMGRAGLGKVAKENLPQIIEEYKDQFELEAARGIKTFINNHKHALGIPFDDYERIAAKDRRLPKFRLPREVIEVLESRMKELTEIAALLNIANINSTKQGIYRPDLGLNMAKPPIGVDPEKHAQKLARAREYAAYDLMWNISQVPIGSMPSRRARKYGFMRQGQFGERFDPETGERRDAAPDWFSRRQQLARPSVDIEGETYTSPMAILPEFGAGLDDLFRSKRLYIKNQLGNLPAQLFDAAAKRIERDIKTVEKLFADAEKELQAKGVTGDDLEKQASKLASNRLKATLKKEYPEMPWEKVGWEKVIDLAKKRMETGAYRKAIRVFLESLITTGSGNLPVFNTQKKEFEPGPEVKLKSFINFAGPLKDAISNIVSGLLELTKNSKSMVEEYILRLILKAREEHVALAKSKVLGIFKDPEFKEEDVPIKDVINILKDLGITPIELKTSTTPVAKPELPPKPAAIAARPIWDLLDDPVENAKELLNRKDEIEAEIGGNTNTIQVLLKQVAKGTSAEAVKLYNWLNSLLQPKPESLWDLLDDPVENAKELLNRKDEIEAEIGGNTNTIQVLLKQVVKGIQAARTVGKEPSMDAVKFANWLNSLLRPKPIAKSTTELLANPAANLTELQKRETELKQNPHMVRMAVNKMIQKIRAAKALGKTPSNEEIQTVNWLNRLL